MYDVIVAGAGPAGSICARGCAQNGLRTLLLDKSVFPRQKPCGGAVSMHALSSLDFSLPDSLIDQECYGARVVYNGRSSQVQKQERIAILVDRARFDAYLADQAVKSGVEFLQGEKAVDVREIPGGLTICTRNRTFEARYLIGADGVHSSIARFVRRPFQKDETVLAAVSRVKTDSLLMQAHRQNSIDLYFGVAPMGYGWLFPHRGYYSFGIAGLASELLRPREALMALGRTLNIEPEAVQAGYIPLGGIKRRVAARRILLAGDAAGFADPVHGEGISYAILSGKLAGNAIVTGIKDDETPANIAYRYTLECEHRIRKQLRFSFYFARLIDRFPGPLVRIFLDNERAIEQYLEIPVGRSDYRRFIKWLAARAPFYLLSSYRKGRVRKKKY